MERVRRNHLNDIENIVPFVLIGFGYVACNPSPDLALWHFRLFFFSRVLHTFAYQVTTILLIFVDMIGGFVDSFAATDEIFGVSNGLYHDIVNGDANSCEIWLRCAERCLAHRCIQN